MTLNLTKKQFEFLEMLLLFCRRNHPRRDAKRAANALLDIIQGKAIRLGLDKE